MVSRPAAPLAASTPRALPSAWSSAEAKSDGDRRRGKARRCQSRCRLRRYGPGPGPIHWWGGRRLAATWAGVQRVCYFTVPFRGGAGLHHGLSIFASPDERTELMHAMKPDNDLDCVRLLGMGFAILFREGGAGVGWLRSYQKGKGVWGGWLVADRRNPLFIGRVSLQYTFALILS